MVTNHWVLKSSMSQVFHGAFKYSSQEILSELKVKLSSRLHIINVLPHLLLHGYWVLIYDVKSWRGDSNLMQSVNFLRLASNISHQMSIFDLWHKFWCLHSKICNQQWTCWFQKFDTKRQILTPGVKYLKLYTKYLTNYIKIWRLSKIWSPMSNFETINVSNHYAKIFC